MVILAVDFSVSVDFYAAIVLQWSRCLAMRCGIGLALQCVVGFGSTLVDNVISLSHERLECQKSNADVCFSREPGTGHLNYSMSVFFG